MDGWTVVRVVRAQELCEQGGGPALSFLIPFSLGGSGGGGGGGQASNNVAPSAPGVVVVAVQGKQLLLYTSQPPTYLLVSLTCNRACSRSRALFLLPYAIVPLQTVMSSSIVSSVLQGL